MINLRTELGKLSLANPILAASGTFGFGREYSQFFPLRVLGGLITKGLTVKPREGNPPPRILETPSGVLNSIGLQNPGLYRFIEEELPFLRKEKVAVIANVAGETVEEYLELASVLSSCGPPLVALELNVSCPNVARGCLSFGSDPASLYNLVDKVRSRCSLPLIVKLTPNDSAITETARAAEAGGADALSLINTLKGLAIDLKTKRPYFQQAVAGLSGPAIRPVALRMVWDVYRIVRVPLVGVGGITNLEDVLQFFMAGASAVAIGTANFIDPFTIPHLLSGLEAYLRKENMASLRELCGLAHRCDG